MDHETFTPAEGRNVVFQIAEGEYRPAQIVRVWMTEGPKTCNLVVFVDGSNDAAALSAHGSVLANNPVIWRTSVCIGDQVGRYLPRKPVAA